MEVTHSTNNIRSNRMSRYLLALFAIVVIISSPAMAFNKYCPKNEVWTSCGSMCQPTCANPHPICIALCVPRCECRRNWLRNENGVCISPRACSACGEPQIYY